MHAFKLLLAVVPALLIQQQDDLGQLRMATGLEWASSKPWGVDAPLWGCVHRMTREWRVTARPRGTTLEVRNEPNSKNGIAQSVIRIKGGKLVGTDVGEFGGDVRWITNSGDTSILVRDNLVQFLEAPGSIYAVTGLAHIGTDRGKLWRLTRTDRGWRADDLVDLGSAPQAALIDSAGIVVVGLRRLTAISLAELRITSWVYPDWYASYANSVVRRPDGTLYIGLRQGITRLASEGSGYNAILYVPRARTDSLEHAGCK